nr:transglutaminase family protein [Pseudomonas typographi]
MLCPCRRHAVSIHVALHHVTHYRYDRAVALGPQIVRLRPAPHSRTRILSYSLTVEPREHFINWQQDPQGNYLARLVFPEKAEQLRIDVDLVAEMAVFNPFDFFLEPYAEYCPFSYGADERRELTPYLETLPLTAPLQAYLARISRTPRPTVEFLVELNQRVSTDVRYLVRMEPGVQTPEQTLELGRGSCRDSAWLMVQVLRHLGLAARFVSGYLIQLAADVEALDGPSGTDVDFTDLHAWCEVYLPGAGWIGLDATSGMFAGEGHIPLACSPAPTSAAPITGAVEPCECAFSHEMSVQRIWEAPRASKPYSEQQWAGILASGEHIDAALEQQDVRLAMGGEPTFVSVDDPHGAEWNATALGPNKRRLASDLYHRLRQHYAPQGLVHCGQGQWYPGEPLPRWSLNCFWQASGEPIWHNGQLIANEQRDYGATSTLAAEFLVQVAERLGLPAHAAFPAFEDTQYYRWREARLPADVNPQHLPAADDQARGRLRAVFSEGGGGAAGQVLPLARSAAGRWLTSRWYKGDGNCWLVPGDSALGYRLPLAPQPWVAEASDPLQQPAALDEEAAPVRTALCAEPRGGRLYIFMPPLAHLDDYLTLVQAIEASAETLGCPVLLEGYEPPPDPRLVSFRVVPDIGVIKVNIHPSGRWGELVERTEFLYGQARQCRLASEKFMIDGRHTGTGGGNHFALGGATRAASPFLRRPDLLRSLVSYWHNHPSLSYLFSGLFIGPTSQAPRIDEGRGDALYELEVAFAQMPEAGAPCPPWLVDRLLRHLLADAAGNTHRAEFCIDKLYPPGNSHEQLGLLTVRAFEMPPHARMSLAQQLLLRALVARFWASPYAPARLARWGTELHDRFMLPHFIAQDFADVLAELSQAGYAFDAGWFDVHHEFRFPKLGDYAVAGIELELRRALEPWHLLGEEGVAGGSMRYIDASLERLQVKLSGLPPERYVLTCNGRPVPLRPTGTVGEFVAGVRYRAWQPSSALQPTIVPHAPLVFDLVDTWMQRSLGGCQYHVAHPGGRNYETFPVNANEAESRRLARFFRLGHTPGAIAVPALQINPLWPMTLDMRCP